MEIFLKFIILILLSFLVFFVIKNSIWIEIFKFLIHPNFRKSNLGYMNMISTTLKISLIHILFALLLILLFTDKLSNEIFDSFILDYDFIELVLITPILEELIFRYPMRKPLISFSVPTFSVLLKVKIYPLYFLLLIAQLFVKYLLTTKKVASLRFFIINFRIYLFLSAITFSILHINFISFASLIYIFLHFASAIVFSWIRVKFNINFAILAHSLYNLNLWIMVNLIDRFF